VQDCVGEGKGGGEQGGKGTREEKGREKEVNAGLREAVGMGENNGITKQTSAEVKNISRLKQLGGLGSGKGKHMQASKARS